MRRGVPSMRRSTARTSSRIKTYTLGDHTDQGEPAHLPMPKSPVRDRKSLDALAVLGRVSP
jgi:hypothetical protein